MSRVGELAAVLRLDHRGFLMGRVCYPRLEDKAPACSPRLEHRGFFMSRVGKLAAVLRLEHRGLFTSRVGYLAAVPRLEHKGVGRTAPTYNSRG